MDNALEGKGSNLVVEHYQVKGPEKSTVTVSQEGRTENQKRLADFGRVPMTHSTL
jgi:hypothetical protein